MMGCTSTFLDKLKVQFTGHRSPGTFLRFRHRQLNEKRRAFAQLVGGPNLAAVDVHNRFGDGKSQVAALGTWVASTPFADSGRGKDAQVISHRSLGIGYCAPGT